MVERWDNMVEMHLAALRVAPTLATCGWCLHLLLVRAFHQPSLVARLDMARMEDVELAERDVIFLQCWYSDPVIKHSLVMTSPTRALAPRHHRLVQAALDTADDSVDLPEMHGHLQQVSHYLSY